MKNKQTKPQLKKYDLHLAARDGDINEIMYLIGRGADVNSQDEEGNAALHVALSRPNNSDVIKVLLEHGADINLQNKYLGAALHIAASCRSKYTVDLILAYDPKINLQNKKGETALHYVAGNLDKCKLLVQKGASPNIQNREGETPFIIALKKRNYNIAQYLKLNGAKPYAFSKDMYIRTTDWNGVQFSPREVKKKVTQFLKAGVRRLAIHSEMDFLIYRLQQNEYNVLKEADKSANPEKYRSEEDKRKYEEGRKRKIEWKELAQDKRIVEFIDKITEGFFKALQENKLRIDIDSYYDESKFWSDVYRYLDDQYKAIKKEEIKESVISFVEYYFMEEGNIDFLRIKNLSEFLRFEAEEPRLGQGHTILGEFGESYINRLGRYKIEEYIDFSKIDAKFEEAENYIERDREFERDRYVEEGIAKIQELGVSFNLED